MQTDDELPAVRRLLQEATERVARLERDVEMAYQELGHCHSDLRELLVALGMGDHARPESPHEVFQQAIALAGSYRKIFLTSQKHVLHVYGCAACEGEHHGIWTQELKSPLPEKRSPGGRADECDRAYVCPAEHVVVLVSRESEETYRG